MFTAQFPPGTWNNGPDRSASALNPNVYFRRAIYHIWLILNSRRHSFSFFSSPVLHSTHLILQLLKRHLTSPYQPRCVGISQQQTMANTSRHPTLTSMDYFGPAARRAYCHKWAFTSLIRRVTQTGKVFGFDSIQPCWVAFRQRAQTLISQTQPIEMTPSIGGCKSAIGPCCRIIADVVMGITPTRTAGRAARCFHFNMSGFCTTLSTADASSHYLLRRRFSFRLHSASLRQA
jgi:hypothetical protein